MKLSTKKYRGDAVRTHKALMKILNKDGFFKDVQKNRFYISKSEKKRESRKFAISKETKRRITTESKLDKIDQTSYMNRKRNTNKRYQPYKDRKAQGQN